ncbi:MAG: hypothetical protein ACUVUR_00415 [bacterium]
MRRFMFGVAGLVVITTGSVFASWQQLGPMGADVAAMTNVPGYPDEVYLVVGRFPSFVLHSTDAGNSWEDPETIPDIINTICVNPEAVRTLYAGGRTRRVYKSTNGGASWQVVGNIPGDPCVRTITVNPRNGSEVWASAEINADDSVGMCLFYSTNAGVTWTGSSVIWSSEAQTRTLLIDYVNSGRAYIGGSVQNRAGLFLTTNYGASWQDRSSGLGGRCVYGLSQAPNDSMVMVCATDSGIYYTSDRGQTWTRRLSAPVYSVAFAPISPFYAYSGGENLVYRSNDYGWTWRSDTTNFFGTNTRYLAINPNRPLELYAGNSYGLFHTTNGGADWTYRANNLHNLNFSFIRLDNSDTIFAGVEGYGIIRSTDAGISWLRWGKIFPGSGWVRGIDINLRHPDTIICVTGFDHRLHVTIDRGDSWETFPIQSDFEPAGVAYHPSGYDTIYTWGGKRDSAQGRTRFAIYRSTNQGQIWSEVLLGGNGSCVKMIFSSNADTIIAYGKSGPGAAVFRSTDRGRNWISLTSGISGTRVLDLKVLKSNPAIWFCVTPSGVFKSENSGLFWTNIGLSHCTCILPDTANPNRVWAGTDTQGFYWTTNNGAIWDRETLGVPGRSIAFLLRHPSRQSVVYAGVNGHSIIGQNVIGVEESAAGLQDRVKLSIMPSLVSRRARIIVSPIPASVALFDPTGRLVSPVLLNSGGVVDWHRPRKLPAGVYLIVARTGATQKTKQMLLLPWR